MFKRLKTLLLPLAILAATLGLAPNAAAFLAETRVGGYHFADAASRQVESTQTAESQQANGFSWYNTASEYSVAAKSTAGLLTSGTRTPNAGGVIRSFAQESDQVYYRVFSENAQGRFLTATPPRSSAWAREALALPEGNQATYIQKVLVPAETRLQRSRALPAFGRQGGAEQFELLDKIPNGNFGAGSALP